MKKNDSKSMEELIKEEPVKEKEVDILHDIDYTKPGVYEITYQIEIEENEPGTVRLIVVVRE